MRILVVEDDPALIEALVLGLRNERYAVDAAASSGEAVDRLRGVEYDAAYLDLGLPDGDGLELLRRLHTDDDLCRPRRIIVVTGRDSVGDRVAGLDAGADDYLTKPFDFAELLARLRALGRREVTGTTIHRVGDIAVDLGTHQAWRADRELQLTPREFSLLRYLVHHPGRVVSSEELLEHVWDVNADPFSGSVRVILSRLRRKLGTPDPITTVIGAGYRLEALP